MSDYRGLFAPYRFDIPGFARDLLGIRLHPDQITFCEAVTARGMEGWRPAYHTLMLSSGNRAGKTLVLAIVILWSCVYKVGQQPPPGRSTFSGTGKADRAYRKWLRSTYMAFHFGIQQEIAGLVFTELVNISNGIHVAQKDGFPLGALIPTLWGQETKVKYNGDYPWLVLAPQLGGAEMHFRTTAERAHGSLGRDMHLVSFDEAGFDPKLAYIVDNVLHNRRLGTGGQMLLVSTPEEGLTEFADFWFLGDPEALDRKRGYYSVRMSTRSNIGFGIDQQTFDQLIEGKDDAWIAQNIDGHFIQGRHAYFNAIRVDQCFVDGLPEASPALNGHAYVQGVDPALRHDSSFGIVFDTKRNLRGDIAAVGVLCNRIRGKQTTESLIALAANGHNAYDVKRNGLTSWCQTAIDATGFGGKMFRELLEQTLPSVRAIEFGGSVQKKRKLLGDLRTLIDSGRLKMPRRGIWLVVRRQLLGYRIDDRGIEQDAVMALACAVAEMRRSSGGPDASVPFENLAVLEANPNPDEDWLDKPYERR